MQGNSKEGTTTTFMSLFSPSITSSSGGTSTTFTINSFTQNLASVLSDPRRTKSEQAAFFTRHWGEQFVPRHNVPPAQSIPAITLEHFRHYLATTARKHRQYLRARRSLRRSALRQQQQANESAVSREEVADIFFSNSFQKRDKATFESVFLEPGLGEPDRLLSTAERRRMASSEGDGNMARPLGRHESVGSLTSMQSVQQPSLPVEACHGRMFRACQRLQQRLEFFDDAIGALLNQQLESKNEQFWRTIHAYGTLEADLGETIGAIREIRQKMARSKRELCQRSERILQLHFARLNRQRMMARLQEIACLRDAQTTVQMLLNQEDVPSALECIHTAREVLRGELRGVNCFRHLGSQLEEMTRAIGKMLLEEFEGSVQREFATSSAVEQGSEENQLQPIVCSLISCSEFRFLTILREEIAGTVKNTTKQVVKAQLLECLDIANVGFNPSTLSEQLVKLSERQWTQMLRAVCQSLATFCTKILAIQLLVLRCAAQQKQSKQLDRKQRSPSAVRSPSIGSERSSLQNVAGRRRHPSKGSARTEPQASAGRREEVEELAMAARLAKSESAWRPADEGEEEESPSGEGPTPTNSADHAKSPPPPGTAGALLSMPCHDVGQLQAAASQLLGHAIHASEERLAKLVQARLKDSSVLASCSPREFNEMGQIVAQFVASCQQLLSDSIPGEQRPGTGTQQRSPAQAILQQGTSKFLANFTESRRRLLSSTIDEELWKPSAIPAGIQRLVRRFTEEGVLSNEETTGNGPGDEHGLREEAQNGGNSANSTVLMVGDEPFIVVGSACLLLRLLAEYSDLLRLFPSAGMELYMDVVQCLKLFNSRCCQLILGTGACQLVGLKTITVKHLALASRSIQLIARFIPSMRQSFADRLPADRQNLLRHFDSTARDYADHVGEIRATLLGIMDKELIGALEEWKLEGNVPTPSFQQIVMQIGKFYSSYSAIMPPELTTEMLHLIHANFRLYFKQHCQSRGISPHDSLTYGMAGQEFAYYVENVRAFPDCKSFPEESIADVLQQKK